MPVNINHVTDTITAIGGTGLLNNIGPGGVSYQLFTSSSTWTKPTGAIGVYVECVGGGGGGGTGAYVNDTTHPSTFGAGGGGGAGGVFISRIFVASSISSTVSITVGAGGAGGAFSFGPLSTSAGQNAFPGGSSSFGSYISTPQAPGGLGGPVGGSAPSQIFHYYGNLDPMVKGLYCGLGGYGNTNTSSTSVARGQIGAWGPGGGGQGGGVVSGPAGAYYLGYDGGLGFGEINADRPSYYQPASFSVGGAQNGGEQSSANGDWGFPGNYTPDGLGGDGGGGGNGGYNGSSGGGGYGVGGGGGGGSGATNQASSNNPGGAGGAGYVRVVTW
jgi:hypothetical protein